MSKKRAQGIIVSGSETAPENPFADFIPETITLTTEERDAEREHLADFFARKLADPTATGMDPDADVVVHCKVQPRAEAAARALEAAGYARVRVLEGGILAWVADVDPSQASY